MDESWSATWVNRPPDWRWLRATELSERDKPWPRYKDNDNDVLEAANFRCEMTRAHSLAREKARKDALPSYTAWKLRTDPKQAQVKNQLEARLLTGDIDSKISMRLPVLAKAVDIYEKWFYNVRDRLDNWGWIFHQLIAPLMPLKGGEQDFELLWKYYGFWGGGLILDSLIYGFCSKNQPRDISEVKTFWDENYRSSMTRKAAVAAHFVPINWETQIRLLDNKIKMARLIQVQESTKTAAGEYPRNVFEAVNQVPWVYDENDFADPGGPLISVGGASLRSQEAILATKHPLPDGFQKLLQSAVFPDR